MTLAFAFSVVAETQQISAKVTRIKGSARYSTDSATWNTLKVGQSLPAGTVVQTAQGSFVDLILGETTAVVQSPKIGQYLSYQPLVQQNTVRIYQDSMLALDKLTSTKTGMEEVSETQLDLRQGKIFGKVKKLSAASKYEIKLPNGVAGIRGTVYTVDANGVVTVLEGSVVISMVGADGRVVTVVVEAGYMYDPRAGGAPSPVPQTVLQDLILAAKEAGIGPETPPTTYTIDQTIINVSPTTGSEPSVSGPPPGE